MNIHIYGLIDPRDNRIKYIGQTVDLERRYKEHCAMYGETAKDVWIAEMAALGLKPGLVHLETVDGTEANFREQWWIELLKVTGSEMVNTGKPAAVEYDYSWFFQKASDDSWAYGKRIFCFLVGALAFLAVLESAAGLSIEKAPSVAAVIAIRMCQFILPVTSGITAYVLIDMTPFNVISPREGAHVENIIKWCGAMWDGEGAAFMNAMAFLFFSILLAMLDGIF